MSTWKIRLLCLGFGNSRGTSAPEMAVTVQAWLAGQANIAVGNIVGSNVFNVLMALGLSALITPLGGVAATGADRSAAVGLSPDRASVEADHRGSAVLRGTGELELAGLRLAEVLRR
jgi:hypothetical protein